MNNTASRHCNLANLHFGQRSFRPNCLVVSANLAGHFSQPVWSHRLRSVIIELRRKQQIFKIGSKSVSQSLIRGFWLEYSVVQARCKVQVSCSSSDNEDCYLSQLKWSLWTIRAWKCPAAPLPGNFWQEWFAGNLSLSRRKFLAYSGIFLIIKLFSCSTFIQFATKLFVTVYLFEWRLSIISQYLYNANTGWPKKTSQSRS